MIDLRFPASLLDLLAGLQARFRHRPPPEDPDRQFALAGKCGLCGGRERPLNRIDLCQPCMEDLDLLERDFTVQGTCVWCDSPQVSVNGSGFCWPCTRGFDFRGTCGGCGARSEALNHRHFCPSCEGGTRGQRPPAPPD